MNHLNTANINKFHLMQKEKVSLNVRNMALAIVERPIKELVNVHIVYRCSCDFLKRNTKPSQTWSFVDLKTKKTKYFDFSLTLTSN